MLLADLVSECKIKEAHILVNAMDFYFCGRTLDDVLLLRSDRILQ
jgi:hypothetical protein